MKTTIYDLIEQLKERLTIVLVTHDTSFINRDVTKVATLNVTLELSEPGTTACRDRVTKPVLQHAAFPNI